MKKREPTILPLPKKAVWFDDEFCFGSTVKLTLGRFVSQDAFITFDDLWHNFTLTASRLKLIDSDILNEFEMAFYTGTQPPEMPTLGEGENYTLQVSPSGVGIVGKDYSGMLEGYTTLLQLIRARELDEGKEDLYIRSVKIDDHPSIKFRAVHICIFPETSLFFLHKMIRVMAMMKFSHIIFEYWGTVRLDSLQELSWPGKSYGKEQLKPLMREARDLGLEMIPFFNHLGHAPLARCARGRHVVLDQNPRLSTLYEPDGWCFCISNPKTRELQKKIRNELIELAGDGQYFHIGCDEADSYALCDRCTEYDRNELLSGFINDIANDLRANGRRTIMWADMMLDSNRWKFPTTAFSFPNVRSHEILGFLNHDIIMADWQYELTQGNLSTSAYLNSEGFDVLTASFDKKENIRHLCRETDTQNLFGYISTTWDKLSEKAHMVYTSSEMSWCGADQPVFTDDIVYIHYSEITRKVLASDSDFEKAGFRKGEIDIYL